MGGNYTGSSTLSPIVSWVTALDVVFSWTPSKKVFIFFHLPLSSILLRCQTHVFCVGLLKYKTAWRNRTEGRTVSWVVLSVLAWPKCEWNSRKVGRVQICTEKGKSTHWRPQFVHPKANASRIPPGMREGPSAFSVCCHRAAERGAA